MLNNWISPETTSTACPSSPPTSQRNYRSSHCVHTPSKGQFARQSLILSPQPIPASRSSPPQWCCNRWWRSPKAPQLLLSFWCNLLRKAATCPHIRSLWFPSYIAWEDDLQNFTAWRERTSEWIRNKLRFDRWWCQSHKLMIRYKISKLAFSENFSVLIPSAVLFTNISSLKSRLTRFQWNVHKKELRQ